MSSTTYLAFAQTAPGLEGLLERELEALSFDGKAREGGVELRLDTSGLERLCLSSRLVESVRVRLKSFVARDFHSLEKGIERLPLRAFLSSNASAEIGVTCHRSRLWHSGAVAERVGKVLYERVGVLGGRREDGALGISVRITGDAVQVSVDAGGYRMHRRGDRTLVEEASMRETLAAAVLYSALDQAAGGKVGAGLAPREDGAAREVPAVIWDPFCGAGTLGLEALSWARGRLPGEKRRFAFERWPTHDHAGFSLLSDKLRAAARAAAPAPGLELIESDRSADAIASARANFEGAGLADGVTFVTGDVEEVARSVPAGAWVLANPPYGKRLADSSAVTALARVLRTRKDLRPAVVIIGGKAKAQLPNAFRAHLRTKSGGTNVALRVLSERSSE